MATIAPPVARPRASERPVRAHTPTPTSARLPTSGSLWWHVFVGLLVGATYAFVNVMLDRHATRQQLPIALHGAHLVVDRAIPLLAGALFGVAMWTIRLRSAARALESERAERLDERLRLVERDHAAFVVAAATLHELKNPLHALGLLLEEAQTVPASQEREKLFESSRAKIEQIRDRLDALRTIAATPQPAMRTFEATGMLATCVRELAIPVDAATVSTLQHAAKTYVVGDPAWLRIAVENVVRNAAEALADQAGVVAVKVEREGGALAISIADDGPGIPPARAPHLFEPFGSTKQSGHGLGLPIARALMRAMGGDLVLAPKPGWSTNFVLSLPLAAEEERST